jgi:hypothetical protein
MTDEVIEVIKGVEGVEVKCPPLFASTTLTPLTTSSPPRSRLLFSAERRQAILEE